MTIAIDAVTVLLAGEVAPDVTALEIDGAPVTIDAARTWSHAVALPATGVAYVAVTAIAPLRTETRLVAVERMPAAPGAAG